MAKTKTAETTVRAKRSKTPAQIAQRDRNIALAAKRLEALQKLQKLAKQLRLVGFVGTDQEIVDAFNKQEKARIAKSYIDTVLATPVTGIVIRRWLKDRILQSPENVKLLIIRFLSRDGSDGGKDNSEHRRNVEDALEQLSWERVAA